MTIRKAIIMDISTGDYAYDMRLEYIGKQGYFMQRDQWNEKWCSGALYVNNVEVMFFYEVQVLYL